MPNVSTCRVTAGSPFKTARGPAASELRARRTAAVKPAGPATFGRGSSIDYSLKILRATDHQLITTLHRYMRIFHRGAHDEYQGGQGSA